MASEKKKRKIDKKRHPGRGSAWLKSSGVGMKGISFFTPGDRRMNNKIVKTFSIGI